MAEIYVPGAIDIMGSANQMMQFRNSQQAQQANALQMQYDAEDRARADQARKAAAGNALAERARKRELLEIYGNYGATPAPGGTGTPYDPLATLQNKLLLRGYPSEAGNVAELKNKNLLSKKTEAETAGQEATTKGIAIKNIDTRLSYFKRFASSVTTADSAANFARMMAEEFPEFAELYGSPKDAAERSAALFNTDPDAWQRHSVDLNAADLVKATVDAKAAKAPKPVELDIGGRKIFVDMNPDSPTFKQEVTGFDKTLTPNEEATNTAAAAKADWEQKNPGFTIEDTASGKVKVNKITGVVEPLTLDGQTLMPSVKPGVTVNTGDTAGQTYEKKGAEAIIANYTLLSGVPQQIENYRKVKELIPEAVKFMGKGGEMYADVVSFLNNRIGTNISVNDANGNLASRF